MTSSASLRRSPHLQWLARIGYAARGGVFVILGYFTAVAAFDAHARPVDSKDALRALLAQPHGALLLGLTAAGLFAFGAYGVAEAVFRRIDGKCPTRHPLWLGA